MMPRRCAPIEAGVGFIVARLKSLPDSADYMRMSQITSDYLSAHISTHMSTGKSPMASSKWPVFCVLAALSLLVCAPCRADVPAPLAAPPVPSDFCGSIYSELYGDLQSFNTQLATAPPAWTPVSGGPTVYTAALPWANSNTGPQISNADYLPTVLAQLQEMKALGVQGVSIPILFPVLYEPFYGSQAAMQPYITFYQAVAQAARAAGLKVIVDDEIMFSNDIQAGWSNMNAFYSSLTWPEYMAARAQMAATIAQDIQPDFLVLANEPDTETAQTGQQNLGIPADAADMVQAEIAAVQALNLSNPPKLGAGFGSWMPSTGANSLVNYINAYVALPLDYIDYHLLPINTVSSESFLQNTLTIASMAAAAGKPVAVSQAWLSKVAASEWQVGYNVAALDLERSRQTFSFWAPLDAYFMQTAQALANYEQMLYLDLEQTIYLASYQTYGGTAANGGSANCTCTTASCSDYEIMQVEDPLALAADSQSVYTTTAFSYYNQLVTTPDTTPPSAPSTLTGTGSYTGANLSWGASTDDVGVAGYNVYRCTPPAAGQPCTEAWIANTTLASYVDTSLTTGTLYNYQVQAFDFANNDSPLSQTLALRTYVTSASAATDLVATVVSSQEISLTWSPPSSTTGLEEYQVFSGTSPSNLQQIAVRASTSTSYLNQPLAPGTTYYYGIVAVEDGVSAPMTQEVSATTLPLPSPPVNVVGTPTATTIALSWQEVLPSGSLPISYYQVYQGTTSGNLANVTQVSAATHTVTSLSPNTTYYFEVQAVDTGHDDSVPSNQIAVTTSPLPATPASVVPTANAANKVTVTWSENVPSNGLPISSYTVFRGTSPTGLTQLASRTTPQFIDTAVSANTTYYYAVEATDSGHDVSLMSAAVPVATPPMPAAPVDVAPTANGATMVTVTWTENIPPNGMPIQSYNILRGTSPTGLAQLATRTTPQFIDTAVSANTTYYYEIQASDSGHDLSPMSATVHVATPPMPAAPASVAAAVNSGTQVTVTWSETVPPNGLSISSYSIYRGTSPTGLTQLTSRTTPKFIDTGASPNTTYYYAVVAVDTGHDLSSMSATAPATTPAMPAAPANVAATANNAGTQITVTWSESIPPNGLPIQYYNIFRGTSPNSLAKLASRSALQFIDTGVSANTTYYYGIQAVDTSNDVSSMSAMGQFTTQ
jgi:fibronectin type 3 domain-containing protein